MQLFKGFADSQLIMSRALVDDVQQCDFFVVATNVSCGSFLLNHSCFEVPIISYFSSSILRSLCVGCEFSSLLPS